MGEKGGDKVDPKVVKRTQDSLGKIIKKPPLTEKLLGKPPFRFLHDVFTSVIKASGFMKGLFTETEMNSENVKDKESKILFLQKAIDMVSLVVGKPLAAKPSRIVAGLEPDRTNEFLQALADAVNKKVNNAEYVERILKGSGDPPPASKPPRKEKEKERDHSSDKRHKDRDEKKHRDGSRERDKRDKREKSHDRRDRSRDGHRDRGKEERRKKREERDEEPPPDAGSPDDSLLNGETGLHQESKPPSPKKPPPTSNTRRRRPEETNADEEEQHRRDKERSARNANIGEDDIPPQVAAARKMPRPSSARPAAPRVKKNEPEPADNIMIGSGNVPNLIVDTKDDSDSDEEETFLTNKDEEDIAPMSQHEASKVDEDEDHGGLVKKMLETKKELEGPQKRTEIERSHMSDATKRKEREMVQKEIDRLRGSIQTLTRSVNPLGKILDFVQEDLDSMQKELEMWKRENKQNAIALQREESITESSIDPLKAQLGELDQAIFDQLDVIAAVKSNIHKNSDKIHKMLGTVITS
ncbi:hypothetical protein CAPTEDRAFT_220815 [Capitella teleta]|uniref:TRAF3-interacting protein 1 n=1 Tax=Capitella teleta TaxID=283909 RepID=R7U1S7_CAPTE|nr:hypothetical protein CAPTEDRAFT_220815 [Capitella teleta]|eukprot:ELU00184.1 hypothetical protein CAPTEDRAFT_220815 [Capitella teleta]